MRTKTTENYQALLPWNIALDTNAWLHERLHNYHHQLIFQLRCARHDLSDTAHDERWRRAGNP